MSPARNLKGKRLQKQALTVGKFVLLTGILAVIGLFSALLGMRFAVRGTEVPVPKITGKTLEQAKKAVSAARLQFDVIGKRYDPIVPESCVISQFPSSDRHLKAHHKVHVLLSLGPRENPIPDLRGATLRVARLMATQAGYEVGDISEVEMGSGDEDKVIQQFPLPNSTETGSPRIDLLVSTGTHTRYIMPRVVGEDLNRVLPYFENRGFKVSSIRYRSFSDASRGAVVKQFPEPGYPLTADDSILLEVAR